MERVNHDQIYRDEGGQRLFTGLFDAASETRAPIRQESVASALAQANGPRRLRQVASSEEIVDLGQDAAIRLHKLLLGWDADMPE